MTDNRFALVEVQGTQLLTIFDGQTVRVAMKPLVEALGIGWGSQYQKIMADPVLSKGVTLSVIPSERGAQETLTLPLDLVQGWLFKLNPDKVAPAARERVIAYQRECYQVLHDYWVKGAAINPRAAFPSASARVSLQNQTLRLTARLKATRGPTERRMIYQMLNAICTELRIDTPALEELGRDGPDLDNANIFFAGLAELQSRDIVLDHHRRPELLAVSLREVERSFVEHEIGCAKGPPLWEALRLHPAFFGRGPVNARDGTIRNCWIFERAKIAAV